MTQVGTDISNEKLIAILERSLGERLGRACRISELRREKSTFQSSYAVEELEAHLDDGTRLRIVFKNTSAAGQIESAREIRPAFVRDPRREILTYREILGPAQLGDCGVLRMGN